MYDRRLENSMKWAMNYGIKKGLFVYKTFLDMIYEKNFFGKSFLSI